jgi:hypothetical protein
VDRHQWTVRRIGAILSESKLVAAKLALVLFVSAGLPFMPVAEQPEGLSPDASAYAVHEAHAVGDQSLVIEEGTDQPLAPSAWYPALNSTVAEEDVSCRMEIKDAARPGDR